MISIRILKFEKDNLPYHLFNISYNVFYITVCFQLIEPVKQLEWNYKDFDLFLEAFINSWGDIKNEYE